jgi:hypothetical protein
VLIEALEDWVIRIHDEREKPNFSKFFAQKQIFNISVLQYLE